MNKRLMKLLMWSYFIVGSILIIIGITLKDFKLAIFGLIAITFGTLIDTDIEVDELARKVEAEKG